MKKSAVLTVVGISNDTFGIDSIFRVPVPSRWGLKRFVCCSWMPEINENHISEIVTVANEAEMVPIWAMILKYKESKTQKKSTHS